MYLKRKVYDQLLDWKNDTVHSTLEAVSYTHLTLPTT